MITLVGPKVYWRRSSVVIFEAARVKMKKSGIIKH